MLQILHNSGYDLTLGYLSYHHTHGVVWSHFKLSQYTYEFDVGEVSFMVASVELGQELEIDGAASVELNLSARPIVLFAGNSLSQSPSK